MRKRTGRRAFRPSPLAVALIALLIGLAGAGPASAAGSGTYANPLDLRIPGDGAMESCADPSVIRGQEDEGYWYLYCTTDPLNDKDRTDAGFNFRLVPQFRDRPTSCIGRTSARRSRERPSWATADAGLWAPEIEYDATNERYILYVTVTDTTFAGGGSAIAAATSERPDRAVDVGRGSGRRAACA